MPIRLLSSPLEKAKHCRCASLPRPTVTATSPACCWTELYFLAVFRLTRCRVPTRSWSWSIPRAEDGRGRGEFLSARMNSEYTSTYMMEVRHTSCHLTTGDSYANGFKMHRLFGFNYYYINPLNAHTQQSNPLSIWGFRTLLRGTLAVLAPLLPQAHRSLSTLRPGLELRSLRLPAQLPHRLSYRRNAEQTLPHFLIYLTF